MTSGYRTTDRRLGDLLLPVAIVVLVTVLFWQADDVLLLLFLGGVFAVLADAGVRALQRWVHLPRPWSISAVIAGTIGLATGLYLWLEPSLSADAARLAERIPQSVEQLEQRLQASTGGRAVLAQLTSLDFDSVLNAEYARRFLGIFSNVLSGLGGALIVVIVSLYLAAEPATYVRGAVALVPPARRQRAEAVMREAGHALRWWFAGRLASMAVVSIATWIGLALLGVPFALLLAVIAGILSFIPNIGPVIAAVPAVLVAFSQDPRTALYVVLLYVAIQTVESYSITPLIQRRATAVPPALLLAFQLVMGVLSGFIGLFAATPLLVVVLVMTKMLYLHDHLGDRVTLPGNHGAEVDDDPGAAKDPADA